MAALTPIDFCFDSSSPYSCLASEWIEALAALDGKPFWGNDRRAQIERWLESGAF